MNGNGAQTIGLKTLATSLSMRPKRVLEKVNKMGLNKVLNDTGESVSVPDAIRLLQSYLSTEKTKRQTKEKVNSLLLQLNGSDTKPIKTKQPPAIGGQNLVNVNPEGKLVMKFVHNLVQAPIAFLEGVQFKFVALIVAIFVQMHHSAEWYHRIIPDEQSSWYAAYGYAFMVDLFILVVTMEGKVNVAKTFAVLTFLANILYFQCWVGFNFSAESVTNAVSSVLISAIIAYIIYAYTELFVKYRRT